MSGTCPGMFGTLFRTFGRLGTFGTFLDPGNTVLGKHRPGLDSPHPEQQSRLAWLFQHCQVGHCSCCLERIDSIQPVWEQIRPADSWPGWAIELMGPSMGLRYWPTQQGLTLPGSLLNQIISGSLSMNSRNPGAQPVWNGALRSGLWLHFRGSISSTSSAGRVPFCAI